MEKAHLEQRGAVGLELEGGGREMIDAPMIKQASIHTMISHPRYKDLIAMNRLKTS